MLESDADRKLLEDFRESMIGVKHSVLAGVGDGDAVVGENLKKAMKDISSLSKKLKEKRKSLKRRQDVGGPLKNELDNMIEELDKGYHISMKLSQSNGEENLLVDMKELVSSDWRISSAMFKRAFKCQALWCLKFSDWAKFTSMRQVMYSEMDGTNGEIFFECMTSELIQRLLRALPLRVSNKLQFSERFTVYLFFLVLVNVLVYYVFCFFLMIDLLPDRSRPFLPGTMDYRNAATPRDIPATHDRFCA